jgi:hypothetical protein
MDNKLGMSLGTLQGTIDSVAHSTLNTKSSMVKLVIQKSHVGTLKVKTILDKYKEK